MQTSARYEAILELITEIFKDEKPADAIINEYTRARKYMGSKDRRFINESVWDIIRNRRKLEFDINSKDSRDILICYLKDKNLDEVFDGSEYGLKKLSALEKKHLADINKDTAYPFDVELETPKWLYNKVKDNSLLRSFNSTASADFRINVKNRSTIIDDMASEGISVIATPYSPIGIRAEDRVNLVNCIAYKEGKIDVQDEASQLVSILCDVKSNHKIMDYCAGAGGKSLTLAYLLDKKGKVQAHDVDWHRLEQIKPRIERLSVGNIEIVRNLEDKDYDRFIIDAPCSGSGSWRRSPDAKFRLSAERLRQLNDMQFKILEKAYEHTKIGGRIIYITCSILKDENENIVSNFLNEYNGVKLMNISDIWNSKIDLPYPCKDVNMLKLSPFTTNTDGFFMAVFEKIK